MTVEDRIVDAATQSFGRNGVLASRLEDIRREAEVSVGAVYHHFPDKETLYTESWLRALADYQEGFLEAVTGSEDAERGVKDAVRYHLSWVAANREAAALLHNGPPSGAEVGGRLSAQNRAFFKEVLGWWRIHASYGALRKLPREVLQALWLGPAHEYCRHWLPRDEERVPREAARELGNGAWATLKGGERT